MFLDQMSYYYICSFNREMYTTNSLAYVFQLYLDNDTRIIYVGLNYKVCLTNSNSLVWDILLKPVSMY